MSAGAAYRNAGWDDDWVLVPRSARFPIEIEPPPGFCVEDPATWPRIDGRMEYVGGRLLYMPPCGDIQQGVSVSVVVILGTWGEEHPEFFVGGNEAGMLLGGDTRGAEGAVWRRDRLGPQTGGCIRVPPILAVEVAGREEGERELREKARWYFDHGVEVVWIVLPNTREVVVLSSGRETRCREGDRLPGCAALPGLESPVERFFRQLASK
jgi:Uma2 family endonuclease